jgi:hypothetical protein
MPRETATERRAREAAEARAEIENWEKDRPIRLLGAMARAKSLGIDCGVYYRHDNLMMYYEFKFSYHDDVVLGRVDDMTEWVMSVIENRLDVVHQDKEKKRRLAQLRVELLASMTDEEREALGLT